jgi:hypothetical protein
MTFCDEGRIVSRREDQVFRIIATAVVFGALLLSMVLTVLTLK